MQDLAQELMQVEDKAAVFYRVMAECFREDAAVASALEGFAEEEESHSRIMNIVAECMQQEHDRAFSLAINPATPLALHITMDAGIARAREGTLSLRELGETVIAIEYSEWNSLFFYVVNTMKDVNHECKMAAIQLQGHINRIQRFLEQLPLDRDVLARIRSLPPLWRENILVIDDDTAVSEMLRMLFRSMGNVDVAADGAEGLAKIGQKYYALIISDIRMPKLDGIEVYEQVQQKYPSINRRYIFFSTGLTEEQLGLLKTYNIQLIEKPAVIKDILAHASAVLTTSQSALS